MVRGTSAPSLGRRKSSVTLVSGAEAVAVRLIVVARPLGQTTRSPLLNGFGEARRLARRMIAGGLQTWTSRGTVRPFAGLAARTDPLGPPTASTRYWIGPATSLSPSAASTAVHVL